MTDALKRVTTFACDRFNRGVTETPPTLSAAQPVRTVTGSGQTRQRTITYDPRHRVSAIQYAPAQGDDKTYSYTVWGNLGSVVVNGQVSDVRTVSYE